MNNPNGASRPVTRQCGLQPPPTAQVLALQLQPARRASMAFLILHGGPGKPVSATLSMSREMSSTVTLPRGGGLSFPETWQRPGRTFLPPRLRSAAKNATMEGMWSRLPESEGEEQEEPVEVAERMDELVEVVDGGPSVAAASAGCSLGRPDVLGGAASLESMVWMDTAELRGQSPPTCSAELGGTSSLEAMVWMDVVDLCGRSSFMCSADLRGRSSSGCSAGAAAVNVAKGEMMEGARPAGVAAGGAAVGAPPAASAKGEATEGGCAIGAAAPACRSNADGVGGGLGAAPSASEPVTAEGAR
mmetsp:Transcript_42088/g.109121  ORF Transcript_42088/g.109121 Transcript_42088/m.109121 type:complete len:303 (-) Transcript_42088:1887-2795(-)